MIKCKSQFEFDFLRQHFLTLFGSVLVNERKRIIYMPDDKIYQKKYLNQKKTERDMCQFCNFCIKENIKTMCCGIKHGKNKKVEPYHICDEFDIHGKRMITHNRASEAKSE